MLKLKPQIKQIFVRQNVAILIVIIIVVCIGTYIIHKSHASGPYLSEEAENGVIANGASIVASSIASGGKYVQFGQTSGGETGSTCTSPITAITGANATWSNDSTGTWWVDNDPWSGSAGPQTVNICSYTSWYATSQQTDNSGQVETYPDTEYDVGGRNSSKGYSTVPISSWHNITSTFDETSPANGALYDAAYDLWTNYWSNETMIWNQWSTNISDGPGYWGACAEPGPNQNDCVGSGGAAYDSQQVTLGGVSYHFLGLGSASDCSATGESNCEYIFFRDSQVTNGSADLLAAWNWEVSHGYAKATDTPDELEYGIEVTATTGTQTFTLNGLTFNVN